MTEPAPVMVAQIAPPSYAFWPYVQRQQMRSFGPFAAVDFRGARRYAPLTCGTAAPPPPPPESGPSSGGVPSRWPGVRFVGRARGERS